jgi:hypothetical protein
MALQARQEPRPPTNEFTGLLSCTTSLPGGATSAGRRFPMGLAGSLDSTEINSVEIREECPNWAEIQN